MNDAVGTPTNDSFHLSPLSLGADANASPVQPNRAVTPPRQIVVPATMNAAHMSRPAYRSQSAALSSSPTVPFPLVVTPTVPITDAVAVARILGIARDSARRLRIAVAAAGMYHSLNGLLDVIPSAIGRRITALAKLAVCIWLLHEMWLTEEAPIGSHMLPSPGLAPTPSGLRSRNTPMHMGAPMFR